MSRTVSIAFYDVNGAPLAGLTPTFSIYKTLAGANATQPTISELGGGLYAFTLFSADTFSGVAFLVDGGATASPRYWSGSEDPTAIEQAALVPGPGVQVFGVTSSMIWADFFSQGNNFSVESNPSSTSIDRYIQQKGAELDGRLVQESITATDVTALGTTSAPYLWCQETLCLMVALRCAEDMQQSPPPLGKTWQSRLDARLEELGEKGYLALGSGLSAPSVQPDGPTTHIDSLGLDVGDTTLASDVIPPFRKSDLL